jgi:hypothetical protein
MTNNDGDSMNIHDFVEADTLENGDQVVINGMDYLENVSIIKEDDAVMVKGYSHISGDSVTYILNYDTEVGLWSV